MVIVKKLWNFINVLGGDFKRGLKTFADGGEHMNCKPQDTHKIMHVNLKTENFLIMASDRMGGELPFIGGNNFSLSLNINEDDKAKNEFKKLSENGKTIMPLEKVFWGGKFGMLIDQFEIQWMVSTQH